MLVVILACGAVPQEGYGISNFGVQRESGREPAEIDFDDIWFYEEDRTRYIPEIDSNWLAVAINQTGRAPDVDSFETEAAPGVMPTEMAEEIVKDHEEVVDFHCDENLAEDGCFLRLREGMSRSEIQLLIRALCARDAVAYVHPTLTLRGRAFAYFNAFQMHWKRSVNEESRKGLMEQAHVRVEHPGEIYRVDVLAIPFFRALNLLAEDVRVQGVSPLFVPLEPSIRAELSLPLEGCQIGDRIPFVLRVDFSDRVRVDPGSLVNVDLRPGGLQKELFDLKFDPYDYVKAASKSPFMLTGWMKIYSPGEFVIPAVQIRYTCIPCSDDRVRSVETDAVHVKVASILPSKGKGAKLAVPMDDVTPSLQTETLRGQARKLRWQALVLFALAVALLFWSARQWAAMKRERRGQMVEKREDMLAERLRDFLARPPEGPHWVYAGDAGRSLREYLDAKYGLGRDPRQASGAVFLEAIREQVPKGVASRLGPLLDEIDRMIALEISDYPDLDRWGRDVLDLVRRTQSNDL